MPTDLTKSAFSGPRRRAKSGAIERAILHIDMDAFFAQVEQVTNPKLRGKAIAVIGSKARTVIVTSSYEARAFGVKTGMTIGEGKRKCPGLIFVPGNNHKYIDTSVRILSILRDFSPDVEVYSIDEAFVDITGSLGIFGGPDIIARGIKERITEKLGLTCSIGIAPNKLLAKIASDLEKPDGLVIIKKEDVFALLGRLPIEDICGIGKKMGKKLRSLGIETVKDLGEYPVSVLRRKFGIVGERLHYMGLGIDESPVVPIGKQDDTKSIGHSMTFPKDIDGRDGLNRYLLLLSAKVGRRVRREGCAGRTVSLYVRFSDFTGVGKRATVKKPLSLDADIYAVAGSILDTIDLSLPVRLLGVSLTNLSHRGHQIPLLPEKQREFLLNLTIDAVRDRFGDAAVRYAAASDGGGEAGVISPAWRPEGARRTDPK